MDKKIISEIYEYENNDFWNWTRNDFVKFILKYVKKDSYVLDIGCGAGKNMEELQSLGEVYGLDNSAEALTFCRKRGLKNLKMGNAEKTNLASYSFDVITLLDVLEHTNDNLTLKEMGRILKSNGSVSSFLEQLSEDKTVEKKL